MHGTNARVKHLLADALESIRTGLAPIIETRLAVAFGPTWRRRVLAEYLRRRPLYDASLGDLTGDAGVLLTVVLQEWDTLGRHLHGCRHWIDMMRVMRNVWAHASGLDMPVAASAYTAAYELAVRAGLRNVGDIRRRRNAILREISAVPSVVATSPQEAHVRPERQDAHSPNGSVPLLREIASRVDNRP